MSQRVEQLRILANDKKAKVGVLIIAQLIADGFSPEEVLPYFMNPPTRKAKETARVAAEKMEILAPWFNTLVERLSKNTIETLPTVDNETGDVVDDGFDPTSKESIIKELKRQYAEATDPKQKADILVKMAELQRMKQEEIKEEVRHTMVYLPATCHDCPCMLECQKEHPDIKPLY